MALDPVTTFLDIGGKVIDRLWPDPQQRDAAKLELLRMQQTGELARLTAETDIAKGQAAINAEEARSNSLWVAGWRPFIGWTCGCAYAYHFVLQPFLIFALAATGLDVDPPDLEMGELGFVLAGMLGLGTLRTAEKIRGV